MSDQSKLQEALFPMPDRRPIGDGAVAAVYQKQIDSMTVMIRKLRGQCNVKDVIIQEKLQEISQLKLALGLRKAGADDELVQRAIEYPVETDASDEGAP
jgi:hypothetical protein